MDTDPVISGPIKCGSFYLDPILSMCIVENEPERRTLAKNKVNPPSIVPLNSTRVKHLCSKLPVFFGSSFSTRAILKTASLAQTSEPVVSFR